MNSTTLGTTLQNIVTSTSGALFDAITAVIPVVAPVLAAFWAIRFAIKKVGLKGGAPK